MLLSYSHNNLGVIVNYMTNKLPPDQVKYPRIHENDRHLIEHMWNDEKLTQSEIARKLNRSHLVI